MVYNIKEYKFLFDTPSKKEQELAVANKIMDLLNKNKYDSLGDFIRRTPTYQGFVKENNMDNVLKHFGNTLNEEDFRKIITNLNELTNAKQNFEKDNIKTTNLGDDEYNTFKGEDKTYFIDNSISDKSIEDQMKSLQTQSQSFQTSDIQKNTENMFKELERSKKESLNLQYLNEININNLNQEQRELFQAALNYQLDTNKTIRIDLKNSIIIDENDNIMKIENKEGNYSIIIDQDNTEKSDINSETIKQPQKQFVLSSKNNTMYNN